MKFDLTIKALIIGLILSVVMTAANMYLGLKVAMTISANIPCSVIAIVLLGMICKSRSIAEVNLAQATGSVGEGLAAGVIFVFPALVLSGALPPFSEWGWSEFSIVTFSVMAGSILGVVLTGFLRRPMVRDSKELRYPEGVATAEILKTSMDALNNGKVEGMFSLLCAFLGGAFIKIASLVVNIFQESVAGVQQIGNAIFKVGADVSAALVGVGFIIEFNGAMLVAMGGAIAWLIFIPIFSAFNPDIQSQIATLGASEVAETIWKNQVRFIGVGGMIIGGIWSIFSIRKQLIVAIKEVVQGIKGSNNNAEADATEIDLSQKTIWGLIFLGILMSIFVYYSSLSVVGATVASIYTLIAIFFFVAISVYIVGLIGSTNQPVSGITICTFLLAAVFLGLIGVKDMDAIRSLLLIAGVVCLAACLSGTASQNFRTAMIVGGTPKALQIGLIIAVIVSSLLSAPLMVFLDKAYKIGSPALKAPQADMFATMAKGMFAEGATLPWDMVGYGVILGAILILLGIILKKRGSSFYISPMAVAVGIYLPFCTTLPILLGGIVHLAVTKRIKVQKLLDNAIQKGTVLCAGFVAGEAIMAIVIAVLMVKYEELLPFQFLGSDIVRDILSVLVLLILPIWIYLGTGKKEE